MKLIKGMDNVDTAQKLPTVLSLCSGYGGIERGLDLAGFKHRTVAYGEIEAYAIANLANKMENGELLPAPIWSNLKTLPVEPFRDRVDLITGGYPCQPFSAAGKRLGEDDPRHLWPYIRRHIESIRPVRCFFENVEGHISLGLREVISDLEALGYKTAWGIFSAREVGAPHQRKRVYILAHSISAGAGNIGRAFTNEGWESSASGSEVVRQAHRSELSDRIESASENRACKLAHSKHNGSLTTAVRGGFNKASDNDEKGSHESVQFAGSSQPHGSSDLQESDKLGHSQSSRFSRRPTNIKRERSENIGERSDKDLRSKSERSSQTLAHTISEGSQGGGQRRSSARKVKAGPQGAHGNFGCLFGVSRNVWPSRPGEDQHSWEASRTIERELGGASNGCADRVDRIRLLGNGVVPQTAAKAWITLNEQLEE